MNPARIFCTAISLLSALTFPAFSQSHQVPRDPRIGTLLDTLARTETPTMASISPDGKMVAWSVRKAETYEIHLSGISGSSKDVTIRPAEGGSACSSDAPVWSPDGRSLAYASDCTSEGNRQPEIFVWSKQTGASQQITHVTGTIDDIAWSPDGKQIGFLFVENATRAAGALDAMKPWSGVIGEDGVEVQRIAIANLSDKSVQQVTPENLHIYEYSWAPDSKELAYVAANPPGENNWWVAQLYTQDIHGTPHSIVDTTKISGSLHGLQIAVPRFSPDGKTIAFIAGLMSDQGSTGGDIWAVPSPAHQRFAVSEHATGEIFARPVDPVDLTPNRPSTPAFFGWIDNKTLSISEHFGGSSRIVVHHLDTGTDDPKQTITLPDSIGSGTSVMSISAANNGNLAFIRSSFQHAPEVWAGSLSNLRQISHLNNSIKPLWGKSEDIHWTNEGFHVQGWLLYPANYDPGKKYPLVVMVHGGPSSAVTPRWPGLGYGGVPFSALGYFVFMPNPRGSFGQGEKFTQANIRDFGYGDLRDILTGMDTIESKLPIDKDREGLTGWSYGGFMTMFAVTQTTRFHAAVAGAGISDWKSYYGENSIDQWMIPFFGASVYDDPAVYAKSSAIDFIKKVKTPTLVVVGDRDGECPAPQSFEFWHALRAEGVKTQLVVYPNEGHAFRSPDHRRDVLERALNWFETQMPAD